MSPAAISFSSASLHSFSSSLVLTSVEPVAIAVTLEVCGSISIWISTLSGVAPLWMALFIASILIALMSSLEGDGMIRSTTSLTMARATPIEEITSAFSGMLYFSPIFSAKYTISEAAPPPTPTKEI